MTNIDDASLLPDSDSIGHNLTDELRLKPDTVDDIPKAIDTNLMDDIDIDDAEIVELPGAVIEIESFIENVIPPDEDEFTCTSCYLVKHYSQLGKGAKLSNPICADCI